MTTQELATLIKACEIPLDEIIRLIDEHVREAKQKPIDPNWKYRGSYM